MRMRPLAAQFCWFLATVLAVGSVGFVLAWFDAGAAEQLSPGTVVLLIMSAASLAVMVGMIVVAYRIEERPEQRMSADTSSLHRLAHKTAKRR